MSGVRNLIENVSHPNYPFWSIFKVFFMLGWPLEKCMSHDFPKINLGLLLCVSLCSVSFAALPFDVNMEFMAFTMIFGFEKKVTSNQFVYTSDPIHKMPSEKSLHAPNVGKLNFKIKSTFHWPCVCFFTFFFWCARNWATG